MILGNDDGRAPEAGFLELSARGLCTYLHDRRGTIDRFPVFGYAYVPPTPFLLKDWERYDVSRYVDPGCVSPEEGRYSVAVSQRERRNGTIAADLERLMHGEDLSHAVLLFHAPPYQTKLDRAALDGKAVDHAPLDVHIGSIAIRRFIEQRQPWLSLHGHVHEAPRLSGAWMDALGRTILLTAASTMATVGNNNASGIQEGDLVVVLGPEHAAQIAGDGMSRQDVQQFLFEEARIPISVHRDRGMWHMQKWPSWIDASKDDTMVPLVEKPEDIYIVVAGGAGKHSAFIPTFGLAKSVTRKIDLDGY